MIKRLLKPLAVANPRPSSLRSMLVVLSIGQIVATGGMVAALSFQNGQGAIEELSTQLRGELTKRVQQELQRYFAIPHKVNQLNAAAYRRGTLDVLGATRGEAQMYAQIQQFPTISFVFCGTPQNGEFFGVLRDAESEANPYQLSYSNPDTGALRRYYSLDANGDRQTLLETRSKPFYSTQRPWFNTEEPAWSEVYLGFTSDLPNITASTPVYGDNGEVLAVCATDVGLPQEFRTFLRGLDLGGKGETFVIDREGSLVADSTDGALTTEEGGARRPLKATESPSRLISETTTYLLEQFDGDLTSIPSAQQMEAMVDSESHLVEVLPFQDGAGLDWLIVVVVPESRFMEQIIANIRTSTQQTFWLCVLAVLTSATLSIWVARSVTEPILQINAASKELAAGNWDKKVPLNRHDEIGELAMSFNQMADQLKYSFHTLEEQKNAFARFFPPEYLDFLGKSDVTEIVLGEHVSKEMAVMFSDIRGFTTLAEAMTPQESFDFINTYLRHMSPEIRYHKGFVVKFLGDGLMAVFPDTADHAIQAGIAKSKKLLEFNASRATDGLPPIAVGIAIHVGHIMVGMIGDQNRLQADALSDCVNLAARLEGLTKIYNVPLLISGEVVSRLEHPNRYEMRLLDRVIVKGRSEAIAIHEVLNAEEPAVRQLKLKTRPMFDRALEYYRQGTFEQAQLAFEAVLLTNPLDKTAKLYIERIRQLRRHRPEGQWTGIWAFTQK